MGNANSSNDVQQKVGYRVLGVQENSPASGCGFVSFFDFIVAANDVPFKTLDSNFVDIIQEFENKSLKLLIYNYKMSEYREVYITPSQDWSGAGLLGVTIRFDCYDHGEEYVSRVMEVEADSPADLAGLTAEHDYILGSAEKVFPTADLLFLELQENIDKPMEIFVYNSKEDTVRLVVVMPTRAWGGEGILGANVASGYLHQLPVATSHTTGRNEGTLECAGNLEGAPDINQCQLGSALPEPPAVAATLGSAQPEPVVLPPAPVPADVETDMSSTAVAVPATEPAQ